MNIDYSEQHEFEKGELERLFLSVNWSSGHFPDKLVIAYDTAIDFYKHCGFEVSEGASPMCITTLWT